MQSTNKTPIYKVITRLFQYEKFLLVIHKNPDGDTLGAALALAEILRQIGKKPGLVCKDFVPRPFSFLAGVGNIKNDLLFGDYDCILIIDCGDLKMTGFDERLKKFAKTQKKCVINIDHHPKNDLHKIAQINLVDFKASSASEIVYELIAKMDVEINKDIATSLLTGLFNDTGGFKHANTSSKTLEIAAELMKNGGQIKLITKNISSNKSITALKLWGLTLSRLKFHPELKIVSSLITREDLRMCHANDDDIAGIVNLINAIPDSRAAVLFFETPDGKIRASIRTENDDVDVSKIANIFGGGGHKRAAGFTIDGHFKLTEGDKSWQIVLN